MVSVKQIFMARLQRQAFQLLHLPLSQAVFGRQRIFRETSGKSRFKEMWVNVQKSCEIPKIMGVVAYPKWSQRWNCANFVTALGLDFHSKLQFGSTWFRFNILQIDVISTLQTNPIYEHTRHLAKVSFSSWMVFL